MSRNRVLLAIAALAAFAILRIAASDLKMADRWQPYQEIQREVALERSR